MKAKDCIYLNPRGWPKIIKNPRGPHQVMDGDKGAWPDRRAAPSPVGAVPDCHVALSM